MTIPEKLSIGGVSFHKSDVKSYEVKYQGGSSLNTVFMKDGTKISFRDQDVKNKASIMMGIDGATSQKGIKFSNVNLFSLEGTDKKDYYYLSNSDVAQIDLGDDEGNADKLKFVYDNDSRLNLNSPILTHLDGDDTIVDMNLSNERFINMNEGLFYRPEKGL